MKKTATVSVGLLTLCMLGCEEAAEITQTPINPISDCDSSGCDYQGGGSCRFGDPVCRTAASGTKLRVWGTDMGADGEANASAFCASVHGMPRLVEFVESPDGEPDQDYVAFDLGKWTARPSADEERGYSLLSSITCGPN
jgi:hypothetical protein